jgi:hypothetical protein
VGKPLLSDPGVPVVEAARFGLELGQEGEIVGVSGHPGFSVVVQRATLVARRAPA